jgi:hypothetical protein
MEPLTEEQLDLLYRYWHGTVSPDEHRRAEALLAALPDQASLESQLAAMHYMITSKGIEELVKSKHRSNLELAREVAAPAATRKLIRPLLKVAAALAALFVLAGVAGSILINPQRIYSQHYLSYELPVARGNEEANTMDSCYRISHPECVLAVFNSKTNPTTKELFLAGTAHLKLNNAPAAVRLLEQLRQINQTAGSGSFKEEGEYYLALAYLKNDQPEKAEVLFNQIRLDSTHLYHRAVSSWDLFQLKVLGWI